MLYSFKNPKSYYLNNEKATKSICKISILFKFSSFPDNMPLTPSWERIKVPSIEFFLNSLKILFFKISGDLISKNLY